LNKFALEQRAAGMTEEEKEEIAKDPSKSMAMGTTDIVGQMSMEMELKADGTCSSSATMEDKSDSTSGTWKLEGDTLSITMMSMMEENPIEETLRFKLLGDRLEMILDEDQKKAGTPAYIFVRK
jgi:hypothetical protein